MGVLFLCKKKVSADQCGILYTAPMFTLAATASYDDAMKQKRRNLEALHIGGVDFTSSCCKKNLSQHDLFAVLNSCPCV